MATDKAQRIKVKIADAEHTVNAPTPEYEEIIRQAVVDVNKKIRKYQENHGDRSIKDILTFVALNEAMTAINIRRNYDALKKEVSDLKEDTDIYLDTIYEK